MGLPFTLSPAAGFASIRPGSEALVVFRDDTEIAWLRCLRRGFRHCAVVVQVGGEWVLIDSLSHSICIGKFAAEPISRLAWRYRRAGHIVIETAVGEGKAMFAPPLPFTCVEAVKRVLGIQSWCVFTPYQLHRHLRARSRAGRPDTGGEARPAAVSDG